MALRLNKFWKKRGSKNPWRQRSHTDLKKISTTVPGQKCHWAGNLSFLGCQLQLFALNKILLWWLGFWIYSFKWYESIITLQTLTEDCGEGPGWHQMSPRCHSVVKWKLGLSVNWKAYQTVFSKPLFYRRGRGTHMCNPSTWDMKARRTVLSLRPAMAIKQTLGKTASWKSPHSRENGTKQSKQTHHKTNAFSK